MILHLQIQQKKPVQPNSIRVSNKYQHIKLYKNNIQSFPALFMYYIPDAKVLEGGAW